MLFRSIDSTVSTYKENKKTALDKQAKIPLEIALNLFDITIWEYDLADESFQYIAQSNDQLLSFPQKTAINDVLSKILQARVTMKRNGYALKPYRYSIILRFV